MKKPLSISIIFHIVIMLLLTFGLPFVKAPNSTAQALVVIDIVKISSKTNLKENNNGTPKDKIDQKKTSPKPPPPPPPPPQRIIEKAEKKLKAPAAKLKKDITQQPKKVEIIPKKNISKPISKPKLIKNTSKKVVLSSPKKRPKIKKTSRKVKNDSQRNIPNKLVQSILNDKKRKDAANGVLQNLAEMTAAIDAKDKQEAKKKKQKKRLLENVQKVSALSTIGKVKKIEKEEETLNIGITIMQAIQAHISNFYSPPPATRLRDDERIKLKIFLDKTANVTKVEIIETQRYNSDRAYRAVARASQSAILEASPLPYLPPHKYEKWKVIILNYSPR